MCATLVISSSLLWFGLCCPQMIFGSGRKEHVFFCLFCKCILLFVNNARHIIYVIVIMFILQYILELKCKPGVYLKHELRSYIISGDIRSIHQFEHFNIS